MIPSHVIFLTHLSDASLRFSGFPPMLEAPWSFPKWLLMQYCLILDSLSDTACCSPADALVSARGLLLALESSQPVATVPADEHYCSVHRNTLSPECSFSFFQPCWGWGHDALLTRSSLLLLYPKRLFWKEKELLFFSSQGHSTNACHDLFHQGDKWCNCEFCKRFLLLSVSLPSPHAVSTTQACPHLPEAASRRAETISQMRCKRQALEIPPLMLQMMLPHRAGGCEFPRAEDLCLWAKDKGSLVLPLQGQGRRRGLMSILTTAIPKWAPLPPLMTPYQRRKSLCMLFLLLAKWVWWKTLLHPK